MYYRSRKRNGKNIRELNRFPLMDVKVEGLESIRTSFSVQLFFSYCISKCLPFVFAVIISSYTGMGLFQLAHLHVMERCDPLFDIIPTWPMSHPPILFPISCFLLFTYFFVLYGYIFVSVCVLFCHTAFTFLLGPKALKLYRI